VQDNIRKIRQWKNIPQKTVASNAGIPQSALSRIEAGGDVAWSKILRIAKALDVSIEDLISFDSKVVFNQFGKRSNGIVIQSSNNTEQQLSDLLETLKKENAYLKKLLEKAIGKKQNPKK
jgi:transcriptional regulator with XRE-family HTH domain